MAKQLHAETNTLFQILDRRPELWCFALDFLRALVEKGAQSEEDVDRIFEELRVQHGY